jgi:hypothetical protein
MAGRPKSEQSDEKRSERTVVRWTATEKKRLEDAKKEMGLAFEVDVIRILTLRGLDSRLAEERENVAE